MTSNSWHGEADPSRQCCCGMAGVTACPAPGRCPARSWQMVLKPLVCIEGGRLQVRRGGRATQRAGVWVLVKGTPMDWAAEGSHHAPGRQMFQLSRAHDTDLHTSLNN
ncbi:unnamed protein product [Pleuronectes platessa]|uniref:Uncharacterized protein n=1 Tax=Pleuronectes platessa TaxID=8262 RepID=A0A9N7VC62_PLEPL|nr:unnamed protein product [Pleuronectes platessa]